MTPRGGPGGGPDADAAVDPISDPVAEAIANAPRPGRRQWQLLMAAWIVALVATLGALFIGEVMGMTPCLLCWYQRILMFPLAVVLGIAALLDDRRGAVYGLPFALGGVVVAGYHTALLAGWAAPWWVPCGAGPSCSGQSLEILGGVPIPWLALAAFVAIAALLILSLRRHES